MVKIPVRSGFSVAVPRFLGQALHPHGGVVVVDYLALSGQRDQSLMHRFESLAGLGHEFPLRRGGQTHAQVDLHSIQPVVGHARCQSADTPT